MTIRRRILVSGQVQGVFFRDTARRRAAALGIAGSARNLPDGRVEICLEGDEAAMQDLIEWCHEGPPWAEVSSVEVIEEEPRGEESFRIR